MEETNGGELTFKMLWDKLKRSALRILIYALVAMIIATGLLGIANLILTKNQYETRITYYYSGVESGNNPWGGQNEIAGNIKSVSNVTKALAKCKYEQDEIDKLINPVIKNLMVTVSTDSQSAENSSANYNFRIVLAQNAEMDKLINSKNDYKSIVTAITESYIDSFKNKFSFNTSLVKLEIINDYNAFQKYGTIKSYMDVLVSESDTWASMAPDFVSSEQKLSFGSLLAKTEALALKLESYKNYILINGINENGESDNIDLKIKEYADQIKIYDDKISSFQSVLDKITQNPSFSTPTGGGTIIVNPNDTTAINEAIIEAVKDKATAQENENNWKTYKEYYTNSTYPTLPNEDKDKLQQQASKLEKDVVDEYNSIIGIYGKMIEDYNASYSVQSIVRQSKHAEQTSSTPMSSMIWLLVEAAVFVLAVLVALAVTAKKGAMNIRRKSHKVKTELATETNAPQQLNEDAPTGKDEERND